MRLEHFLTSYIKINSKWIKDKYKTRKLVEENIGRTLFDINYSSIFFGPPPKVMKIKTKIIRLPWWLSGKESACSAGDMRNTGSIPGSGKSPEKEMATHSSILA